MTGTDRRRHAPGRPPRAPNTGKRRYSVKTWKCFNDVFNCLPICAVIDDKVFCVHGGLSPELKKIDQINKLVRPSDVPDVGLLCDFLWRYLPSCGSALLWFYHCAALQRLHPALHAPAVLLPLNCPKLPTRTGEGAEPM